MANIQPFSGVLHCVPSVDVGETNTNKGRWKGYMTISAQSLKTYGFLQRNIFVQGNSLLNESCPTLGADIVLRIHGSLKENTAWRPL